MTFSPSQPPPPPPPLPSPPPPPPLPPPPSTVPLLLLDDDRVQLRVGLFPILEKSVAQPSDWASPTLSSSEPKSLSVVPPAQGRAPKRLFSEVLVQDPPVGDPPLRSLVAPTGETQPPRSTSFMVDLMRGRCIRCGESGHRASHCRNPKLCFRCGQTGHLIALCPSASSSSSLKPFVSSIANPEPCPNPSNLPSSNQIPPPK